MAAASGAGQQATTQGAGACIRQGPRTSKHRDCRSQAPPPKPRPRSGPHAGQRLPNCLQPSHLRWSRPYRCTTSRPRICCWPYGTALLASPRKGGAALNSDGTDLVDSRQSDNTSSVIRHRRPTRPRAGSAFVRSPPDPQRPAPVAELRKDARAPPDNASVKSALVSKGSATAAHRQPHRGIASHTAPSRQPAQPHTGEQSKSGRHCLAVSRSEAIDPQAFPQVSAPSPSASMPQAAAPERAAGHRRTPSPRRTSSLPSSPDAPVRSPPGTARSSSRT